MSVGDDLGPSGVPNRTYDIVPHAEAPDFDDPAGARLTPRIPSCDWGIARPPAFLKRSERKPQTLGTSGMKRKGGGGA